MGGKRTKKDKIDIKKIIIIIAILIIIVAIAIISIIKLTRHKHTEGNISQSETNIDIVIPKPQIRAYFEKNKYSEEIREGATYKTNISVYSTTGEIESVTHNGSQYEGTVLNDEGTYVITMKPSDGSEKITRTVIIDTQIPTVRINDGDMLQGKQYKVGAKVTLKDEKGINKITKALLVSCNGKYEVDTTVKPIDITNELKNEGYVINQKGMYKIQLLDENNKEIEFTGKDKGFRLRE